MILQYLLVYATILNSLYIGIWYAALMWVMPGFSSSAQFLVIYDESRFHLFTRRSMFLIVISKGCTFGNVESRSVLQVLGSYSTVGE